MNDSKDELLARLDKQEEMLRQKQEAMLHNSQSFVDKVAPIVDDMDYAPPVEPIVQEKPTYAGSPDIDTTVSMPRVGLKEKIEALKQELNSPPQVKEVSANVRNFLDEYGNETYYVKNISDTHVILTDPKIEFDKVSKGSVSDLLEKATIEDIKKSRDVRVATTGPGRTLQRITPEEYYNFLKDQVESQRKISVQRQENIPVGEGSPKPASERVRPSIMGKIEKLNLAKSEDPDIKKLAMTSLEFIEWAASEKFTESEIDYIMSSANNREIRTFMIQKKQSLL